MTDPAPKKRRNAPIDSQLRACDVDTLVTLVMTLRNLSAENRACIETFLGTDDRLTKELLKKSKSQITREFFRGKKPKLTESFQMGRCKRLVLDYRDATMSTDGSRCDYRGTFDLTLHLIETAFSHMENICDFDLDPNGQLYRLAEEVTKMLSSPQAARLAPLFLDRVKAIAHRSDQFSFGYCDLGAILLQAFNEASASDQIVRPTSQQQAAMDDA
jgi:hypothetical protein